MIHNTIHTWLCIKWDAMSKGYAPLPTFKSYINSLALACEQALTK